MHRICQDLLRKYRLHRMQRMTYEAVLEVVKRERRGRKMRLSGPCCGRWMWGLADSASLAAAKQAPCESTAIWMLAQMRKVLRRPGAIMEKLVWIGGRARLRRRICPDPTLPWVATSPEVVEEMLQLAGVGSEDVVYDLGSGDGRILIAAAKQFGARGAIGYELREDLCRASLREIERHNLQDRVRVINGDLFTADLSEASVITLFLSPEANDLLGLKLSIEAKPGTRIVSHGFKIDRWREIGFVRPQCGASLQLPVYLYKVPESVA